jgi:hypothetical protein
MSEYIYVQEKENIQTIPWRNIIIENANTYLILESCYVICKIKQKKGSM